MKMAHRNNIDKKGETRFRIYMEIKVFIHPTLAVTIECAYLNEPSLITALQLPENILKKDLDL